METSGLTGVTFAAAGIRSVRTSISPYVFCADLYAFWARGDLRVIYALWISRGPFWGRSFIFVQLSDTLYNVFYIIYAPEAPHILP